MYQQDGCCILERADAVGKPSGENRCVNFVPRTDAAIPKRKSRII
jgi:hypothetical protein